MRKTGWLTKSIGHDESFAENAHERRSRAFGVPIGCSIRWRAAALEPALRPVFKHAVNIGGRDQHLSTRSALTRAYAARFAAPGRRHRLGDAASLQ